ncbi:MAG TPA: phosphoribosylglycinamide synthetase C domain-containing protein, partial [Oligoflexia bacterium]|nr:phosphoribosylglycinamide synthetase C domain-containing protein [Oligoflexia bacterium]
GPNTGGMGAISPTPVLGDQGVENLVGEIMVPVLRELASRGINYTGFLYAGIIVDAGRNASVLEFNCRLGDPETQVILPRLESDLLAALDCAASARLSSVELRWSTRAAACVVAASRGYPGVVEDGKLITSSLTAADNCVLFHAGTIADAESPELVRSKGGRVLCVSALGDTVDDALRQIYTGIEKVQFEGMHYRRDIGL